MVTKLNLETNLPGLYDQALIDIVRPALEQLNGQLRAAGLGSDYEMYLSVNLFSPESRLVGTLLIEE